jgi:hypothetical protein
MQPEQMREIAALINETIEGPEMNQAMLDR